MLSTRSSDECQRTDIAALPNEWDSGAGSANENGAATVTPSSAATTPSANDLRRTTTRSRRRNFNRLGISIILIGLTRACRRRQLKRQYLEWRKLDRTHLPGIQLLLHIASSGVPHLSDMGVEC